MIEKRPFGRTGHMSTATIFGAAAFWQPTADEVARTLDTLLEYGINHIDTANSYGESEKWIGPWMDQHRDKFFLATKTGERTYVGAKEHLHRSLDLLHTDHIDLWQLHYLVDPGEWETAMGPGGALEAFVEAREQGLVRFLGVTGHDIPIAERHIQSLNRFDFDAVLLPYNYTIMQNPKYAADFEALMKLCAERNVAVQTIKSQSRGPWKEQQHHHTKTWYDTFQSQEEIDKAVHWVLRRPGIFLNTPGDVDLLPRVLAAARRFITVAADTSDAAMEEMHATPLFV